MISKINTRYVVGQSQEEKLEVHPDKKVPLRVRTVRRIFKYAFCLLTLFALISSLLGWKKRK